MIISRVMSTFSPLQLSQIDVSIGTTVLHKQVEALTIMKVFMENILNLLVECFYCAIDNL